MTFPNSALLAKTKTHELTNEAEKGEGVEEKPRGSDTPDLNSRRAPDVGTHRNTGTTAHELAELPSMLSNDRPTEVRTSVSLVQEPRKIAYK